MSKRDQEPDKAQEQKAPEEIPSQDKVPEEKASQDKAADKPVEKPAEKEKAPDKSGNQEQAEYWSGLVGQRWAQYQDEMDKNLRPLGDAALAAARVLRGERVLDVGCGCGDTTLQLADYVGDEGRVTGVDVSKPMIARARERAAGRGHVEFLEADAATATGPAVDLVFSRFGVMFFADPKAAFANLAARLDEHGRIAFVCWRSPLENEWVRVVTEAIDPHLPPEPAPDPDAPGPFAFASRSKIEGLLKHAGLRDARIQPVDLNLAWTRASKLGAGVDFLSKMGPPSRRLTDLPDDVRTNALSAMTDALRPHQTARGLVLGSAVWVVTARK